MTAEPTGDEMDAERDERPLFRLGDPGERLESAGLAVLVILAALLLSTLLVLIVYSALGAAGFTEESAPVVIEAAGTVANFIGFLLAAIGFLYWQDDWALLNIRRPTRRDLAWIIPGLIGLGTVVYGLSELVSQLGFGTAENAAVTVGQENPVYFLVLLPIQFLLTGPAEELLVRGTIQGLFRRVYGIIPGILIASALFGLMHYPALAAGGDTASVWTTIAILFASGIFLGALYEYTENLVVPITVHAIWNTLIFAVQYIQAV